MAEKNQHILFPVAIDEFWRQMRKMVEEVVCAQLANRSATEDQPTSKLLKIHEVCELFQVSKPTVYDWIRKGQLRSIKIESRRFFLAGDVEEMISKSRNSS